jgi:hypothetical protein
VRHDADQRERDIGRPSFECAPGGGNERHDGSDV